MITKLTQIFPTLKLKKQIPTEFKKMRPQTITHFPEIQEIGDETP